MVGHLGDGGAAKLRVAEDREEPPGHEQGHGEDGADRVEHHRERERARVHDKVSPLFVCSSSNIAL